MPHPHLDLVARILRRAKGLLARLSVWALLVAALLWVPFRARGERLQPSGKPNKLERSYWLHASLGATTQKGYWGSEYPATSPPTEVEVRRAARLLTGAYGANRLYLMYHAELPAEDAVRIFRWWRESCPREVELVPTLLLRMYDKGATPVFTPDDVRSLCSSFKRINRDHLAVYDIYPNRDQGPALEVLAREYPHGLLRVGVQPGEKLGAPWAGAVEDTWSGFCHGKSNEDWQAPGFGAETLGRWVEERNAGDVPVSWDLIAVAWDYSVTRRGEYPGYDDAEKNMPLPAGRNRLAVERILMGARPERLLGFSSDLFIVHVNSASRQHDGPEGALYACLKRGERYCGYYAAPLDEIAGIYRDLRQGEQPPER
jgi:hypothetical protein